MFSSIQKFAILVVPVLSAITFHEVAHGYVAYLFGDPTAKQAGRLTLNPIKHIDPIGMIALFLVKVGWAKPVPVNPLFFSHKRAGLFFVSLAGPAVNFALAVVFALIFHGILGAKPFSYYYAHPIIKPILFMCEAGVLINIGFGVFNLLPIPPLDGSNILISILPEDMARIFAKIGKFGFLILIILFFTGVVQKALLPLIYKIASILLPI